MGNLAKQSPDDDKDERLKRLQAEVDTMKTQMLGQRALIQGLAREQGELRAMISQLHQDMKQPAQVRDQVIEQLPRGQRSGPMNRALQAATTSQVQQRPRQEQQVDQSQPDKPKRQFTELNISLTQALPQMLKAGLITLRVPFRSPNTSAHTYHPNERCAYHSDSPGHDTNNCWALKIEFDPPETPNVITALMPNH